MLLSDYILQVQELVHDLAGNDFTTSELTNYINAARNRTALDLHCVRAYFGGPNYAPYGGFTSLSAVPTFTLIANQEAYPINGGAGGLALTAGGSGYTSQPTVTFTASPTGVTASASPTVSSGVVTSVTVTNGASGYVSVPAVTFSSPVSGVTATGTAVVVNGVVTAITITQGGQGYTTAPTITIASSSTGALATATCTIQNGVITALTQTNWGTGYTAAPTVTFTGGGGSGAAATAGIVNNVIDIKSISYLWPGATNRQMLRWLPFTTYNAWCRAWVGQIGSPSAWTTHDGQQALYFFPVPDQGYFIEIDAIITPVNLVNTTDVENYILPPFSDCVQYFAASLARSKLQDYDKADYWRKYYNTRAREINATRIDARFPNIYRQSARRLLRW